MHQPCYLCRKDEEDIASCLPRTFTALPTTTGPCALDCPLLLLIPPPSVGKYFRREKHFVKIVQKLRRLVHKK
ncbi:hypothetical protein KOW79_019773 [Hemibagrus wyckioides]|uniref:Uncharacterized protein n=1 Tax=Hemibagrus wyckioides TaxID=337641 RepID=A0A9D3N8A8_9TELE|nr:hypothetical protein KOW79_019773 [Hemibagrus wyckioides]